MDLRDDFRQSRRRRLWRWFKILGLTGLGLIAFLTTLTLCYRAYFMHQADARLPGRRGDAGTVGNWGMTHRYTSGAFAGSVTACGNHDQEFRFS